MAEPKTNELMEKIVSLCKRRGFVFQSSEIYGGIQGFWDYGPLGSELKRNVKELWWNAMMRAREDVVGLDATIIMHPQIWRASGHVDTFSDPMCDCLLTKRRFRADQIEPQSGIAYHYSGASDPSTGKQVAEPYSVLLPPGKPPESARRTATQFYAGRGLAQVELQGERTEKVEGSTRYNPENGSLLTEARPFNLMLKTYVGPVADEDNIAYLRPETAQAIFAQFKNVLETSRQSVPFGIGQIGKAFRNEVTPRNFTFRSREFEQMELEFFIRPDEAVEVLAGGVAQAAAGGWKGSPASDWGWEVWHKYWVEQRVQFYEDIGLPRTSLEEYWQKPEELAHYARATVDILFKFPFGTQELEGIAARGDFDLSQHQKHSGKSMEVFEEELKNAWGRLEEAKRQDLLRRTTEARLQALRKKGVAEAEAGPQAAAEAKAFVDKLARGVYIPHVIEPSAGADRLILALICHAFHEEEVTDDKGKKETRVVMRFHPRVAPIKVGVFPLLKNKPELVRKAGEVRDLLRPHMSVFYDDAGAIGRRYRRQDEAGTPFGVTIDFDTLGETPDLKETVTLRHRDSMKQERVPITELVARLTAAIRGA
ncbi:MAG TPA: glycine--tRNA ligase [Verrucomicrobiales bacterium]|nr:glycine--tRNA ligase [Verrucomicrobiales bacterium]